MKNQLIIREAKVDDYKAIWKLKGALNVDKRSNFLAVSSSSDGFLYISICFV